MKNFKSQNSIFQLFGQIISLYYYIYYLLYLFIYIYFVSFSPPYLYIVLQLNNYPVSNSQRFLISKSVEYFSRGCVA